ncbi:RebB family R body protein [Zooshikella sp. RANM57]|uniref:RebB family R body protein n=1 Tax=Zooshikella sp. RANM57 TaxID=3425863 RepID=UPI003D6FDC55
MAFPTLVNSQITDSVTQTSVCVIGDSTAIAMGNLLLSTSLALANAAHNATSIQQQNNISAQAATTMSVSKLFSINLKDKNIVENINVNP